MPLVNRKTLAICLVLTCVLAAGAVAGSSNGPNTLPDEGLQNQRGMKYFKHGYYKPMPSGRKAEAYQHLDLAEKAFQKSLENNFI